MDDSAVKQFPWVYYSLSRNVKDTFDPFNDFFTVATLEPVYNEAGDGDIVNGVLSALEVIGPNPHGPDNDR